jgi:hypothetical protein
MGALPAIAPLTSLQKHCDRRSNALIDEHHEYLVLVAKENCVAAAGRSYRTDLNFDNGLTHTQIHILAFPPRPESLPRILATRIGSRTGTITHATPSNSLGKPVDDIKCARILFARQR